MHALLLAWAAQQSVATPEQFDAWAQSRDIESIEAHASPSLKGRFQFLRQNGAFGVGRSGWKAELLRDHTRLREYIVFSTALTTQDYGAQVFRYSDGELREYIPESDSRGVRLTHADMTLYFSLLPWERHLSVHSEVTIEPSAEAGESFFIRLGDNYKVGSILTSEGAIIDFDQAGGVIVLPLTQRTKHTLKIFYGGKVDRPRFAGAMAEDEVMLTNDYWWPSIARGPLTCRTVTQPPSRDWIVIAQGERKVSTNSYGFKTYEYVNSVPVSYLSLSMGPFKYAERSVGGINYFIASHKMTHEEMQIQLQLVPSVIEFFSTLMPHPYTEYGAVDSELYGGGALEAYSYATYGHGWLPDEDAHEPSHTWWGGLIPNTYLGSFWNESFAAFSEGLYAREGAIGNRDDKRQAFISPVMITRSFDMAACGDAGVMMGGVASSLGYGKGGYVLQQLELEMGHEAMVAAMKRWLRTRNGEADDWRGFEAACGPEWKWFFDQWIWRAGWPKVTTSHRFENGVLNVELTQPSPAFRFRLEVGVRRNGKWQIEAHDVVPDADGRARLKIEAAPGDLVSLDPWDRILGGERPALPYRPGRRRAYVHSSAAKWTSDAPGANAMPTDLSGVILYADPTELKLAADLCAKAGFKVEGETLTYRGKTYDLRKTGAIAMVEFEPGKWCGIRLGSTRRAPSIGNASVAITDEYGRFLVGESTPRDRGGFVIRVGSGVDSTSAFLKVQK